MLIFLFFSGQFYSFMLSDSEDQEVVIKVSNLVEKFENEIRKQTPNERFIRSVRQVSKLKIKYIYI